MTDHELVKRCREKDREAQQELYERTSENIYRLLLKMTANTDDAFDLAQETYIKAFAHIDQFNGQSSISTWLYRVAVNEALQFLRRKSLTKVKIQEIASQNDSTFNFEQHSIRLDMNEALDALAPNDRAMLLLKYHEGLDYREIAEVMSCAEGTVASRLNRSREKLRNILRKSYAPWEENHRGEHPKNDRKGTSNSAGLGKQRPTG